MACMRPSSAPRSERRRGGSAMTPSPSSSPAIACGRASPSCHWPPRARRHTLRGRGRHAANASANSGSAANERTHATAAAPASSPARDRSPIAPRRTTRYMRSASASGIGPSSRTGRRPAGRRPSPAKSGPCVPREPVRAKLPSVSATDLDRSAPAGADLAALDAVQRRVLWLATANVHHANRVRPNPSGIKVGGHQASSASMVSLMTALWFAHLEAPDRVSVKPHASPVLHAINFLLGRLDASYLPRLREYGGLQSYPSRSKDPDPVDYSTGSVGIGATATIWGALAHRYVAGHFDVPVGGRQIALLGDAEPDEGAGGGANP